MRKSRNSEGLYGVRFNIPGHQCFRYVTASSPDHAIRLVQMYYANGTNFSAELREDALRRVQSDRPSFRSASSNA
jgi:hypothetical protein